MSAFERLGRLDEVFSLADIKATFGLSDGQARLYAKRWTDSGYVSRFGGGVYFNLVRDRSGPDTRVHEALNKLLRVPVVAVGGYAIHAAGWTTQVHLRHEIAVPVVRGSITVPATQGDIFLTPRYSNWFKKLAVSCDAPEAAGVPVAAPEYALADGLLANRRSVSKDRPVTVPPPDEIDMGGFDEDAYSRLIGALADLGATPEEAEELAGPYRHAIVEPSGKTIYF